MELFNFIKNEVHDASGINNPNDYFWEKVKGIYYPNKKISDAKIEYFYGIIKENNPNMKIESTISDNNYKETKYVLIEKHSFDNGTEKINRIIYDDNLESLQNINEKYVSWYNYPMGKYKNIQGHICDLA